MNNLLLTVGKELRSKTKLRHEKDHVKYFIVVSFMGVLS